jgi:hypothetical protein
MSLSNPNQSVKYRWLIFSLLIIGIVGMSIKMLSATKPKPETIIIASKATQNPKSDKLPANITEFASGFI